MNNVFIIAEAGVNHNGDVAIAKRMIDAAKDAGADAVKFQTYRAEKLVTDSARKAAYQIETTGSHETQLAMLKRFELSADDFQELFQYCTKRKIEFISTPFDEESADMLETIGMKIFKIPSGEITNKPLIQHIAGKGKPIILSTGMSYLEEVEKAVEWINNVEKTTHSGISVSGYPFKRSPVLLHCVSTYPTEFGDVNLRAMKTMEDVFHLPVGFSDHTAGIEAAIASVALGASVIEKHFTLDRTMEGPDHRASLEVAELKAMIKAIRNIEIALGDGVKRPVSNELNVRQTARRSLVSAREIKRGSIVCTDDITIKRPGCGIKPEYIESVIGMETLRDMEVDVVIEWTDLKKVENTI